MSVEDLRRQWEDNLAASHLGPTLGALRLCESRLRTLKRRLRSMEDYVSQIESERSALLAECGDIPY